MCLFRLGLKWAYSAAGSILIILHAGSPRQTILRPFCRDKIRGLGQLSNCYHSRDLEGGMADHELPRESRELASTGRFGEVRSNILNIEF